MLVPKKIKSEQVDFIDIDKYPKFKSDTIPSNRKRLTQEQLNEFVSNWNKAKSKGVYKFISTYYITIYFKDGSKREFRTNTTNLIKEESDWSFECGDIHFFENLWKDGNTCPKKPIE